MLGAFGSKTKRQKLKVPEAWRALTEQEVEKLIDHEAATREAVRRAENAGIVFIDEIDKIATKRERHGADVSREGVQRDLLPIVEGSTVTTKYGPVQDRPRAVHRRRRVPHVQAERPDPRAAGPLPDPRRARRRSPPTTSSRILTEPKNALTRQYAALLATEGVTIEWTADAIARARADRRRRQPPHPRHRRAPPAHRARAPARRPALQRARHRRADHPDHAELRARAARRAGRRRRSDALHPLARVIVR